MHQHFRRSSPRPFDLTSVGVYNYQIGWFQQALVHARRCGEDAPIAEAYGNIALTGHNVLALVHPPPYAANIAAVLFLAFLVSGQHRVRAQSTDSFRAALSTAGVFLQLFIFCVAALARAAERCFSAYQVKRRFPASL